MTSESRFKSATLAKFGAMRSRCQAKVSKKGRMLRAPIPFTLTLDQFRGWALEKFGGAGERQLRQGIGGCC